MRCLVTAGNTREKIDEVRDWGNVFTGNTGLAIAKALAEIASVDLVTSNAGHREEIAINQNRWQRIAAHAFTSHADLKSVLAGLMFKNVYDAVFMTRPSPTTNPPASIPSSPANRIFPSRGRSGGSSRMCSRRR